MANGGVKLASRAMAMMHVAMADAAFSIHPKYESYAVRLTGHRNANKTAAAAAAAYGVLVRLFPAQQAALDAALAQSPAQVEDSRARDQGVALGDEVAAQIRFDYRVRDFTCLESAAWSWRAKLSPVGTSWTGLRQVEGLRRVA